MRCSIRQVYFRRRTVLKNVQTGEVVYTSAKLDILAYFTIFKPAEIHNRNMD
ncbi:MAG: hypothetical protein ACI97K_002240 [Glaciecola sp.]|jgi:hypothetical protein